MPDGNSGDQGPGTPEQQIAGEIAVDKLDRWLFTHLGVHFPTESAAPGTTGGGQFMFANLAELDAVIQGWRSEIDDLLEDRVKISQARAAIYRPASDATSTNLVSSIDKSLDALHTHSGEMLKYAENHLRNLLAARRQMQGDDDTAESGLRNVDVSQL